MCERADRPSRATQALDAEQYYKVMVDGSEDSWNIRCVSQCMGYLLSWPLCLTYPSLPSDSRDRHMMDTLERLVDFYGACFRLAMRFQVQCVVGGLIVHPYTPSS